MNKKTQEWPPASCSVYVGTYTGGDSQGIYNCRLDLSTGELQQVRVAAATVNPSYLAIDAQRKRLYAVNEVTEFDGRPGGGVSAFAIHPESGALRPINRTSSHGGAPCYVSLDCTGRTLLVANYVGGNVAVIPVDEDGALGEATETIAHSGSSLHQKRQAGPHPHSIVLDSANLHAFVPDLGLDKVMQYRFVPENGQLMANHRPWMEVTAGSGPRHLTFHPNGKHAYVINELNSTITACAYDPGAGVLEQLQTITTLPQEYPGPNIAADLHLTPNGKLLIASNRGHNSLAFYRVDLESGRLMLIDFVQTQGRTPRGFAIDPTGTFVLVANQDSHSVVTFRVLEQGTIIPTGHVAHIPSPVCLSLVV